MNCLPTRASRVLNLSILLASVAAATPAALRAGTTLRVYEVGNSLNQDAWDGNGLIGYAAARGDNLAQGLSMCWGRGIKTQWADYVNGTQSSATTYTNVGFFQTALTANTWDAITLQPFENSLTDEMTAARQIVELARTRTANRAAALYLYAPWPGQEYFTEELTFDTRWPQPYTGGPVGTFSTRDYFRQCYATLAAQFPDQHVYLIPTGEVFDELAHRMAAGQVPGLIDGHALYRDGLHASYGVGRYTASVSYFAGLMHEDPRGLPVPSYYLPDVTPAIARAIQESVWHVLTSEALSSGLWAPGDVSGDGVVDFADLLTVGQHYEESPTGGGNGDALKRTEGDLTGDGHVNFDDLLVLAQRYGTTTAPPLLPGSPAFANDWALAQSLVPEPTAALMLAGGAGLATRRRRRTVQSASAPASATA